MNKLTQLIFLLINRLTYRGKFMLISSVFAIPLSLFAVQLAFNFHQQLNQAEHTRSGIQHLQQSTELIEELETLRDVLVVVSWRSNSFLVPEIEKVKKRAYASVLQLLETLPPNTSRQYLLTLKRQLETDDFIRGNEASRIDGIYEAAHVMIRQAYNWRRQLAFAFVSSSQGDSNILSLLNLLNSNEAYTYALGSIRVYGSLYLGQTFVESYGAEAMELSYQGISKLIDDIEVKEKEYADLISQTPTVELVGAKKALVDARELLYQRLIESMSPTGDPKEYYAQVTGLYSVIYQHNRSILSAAEKVLIEAYEGSTVRLFLFYLSVVFFSLVLLCVSVGLYKSVTIAIRELTEAAKRVESGSYDRVISIQAHDELQTVAQAMEQMRLSIKEREEKLESMSQTDGLTQLYNRPFFDQAMKVSLANSRRNMTCLTLVMMDIDHFKKVNDTYGHQAGDECLKLVARLMKDQFKRQTDIAARYGGEEFIAILYGQNRDDALRQTEKLRKAVEDSNMNFQGQTIHMTASFGLVSMTPPNWKDSKELVGLADAALYRAKESGRNRICCAESDK